MSLIVCTKNRLNDLCAMLDSVQKQTVMPDELIIIDSSTHPLSQDAIFLSMFNQQSWPSTKCIYEHTEPGLTKQRNVGLRTATGDILYFFDDDVVLEPTYLASMQDFFVHSPFHGGAMGSIINMMPYRLSIHRIFRMLFLLPRDYASGKYTYSGMPTYAYGSVQGQNVQTLGGCCMAYRKTALENHLFDERLPGYAYMEDCDFAYRVGRTTRFYFNPDARLFHNNSPMNRDAHYANRRMFMRHYTYLFFKNIFPYAYLRIFGYLWSVIGLFLEALLWRDFVALRAYSKGLCEANTPSKKVSNV